MKRVVITGLGIVSSIGNNRAEVTESLKTGKSGIEYCEEYAELGFRSHIHGPIRLNLDELIDRKLKRFMGDAAAFAYLAMKEALEVSGLSEDQISNPGVGLITGSGGGSNQNLVEAVDIMRS
ncbi:MAG: beta-ketoacyl-ACP synthase I, partial [Gammaproteobacteria bacterium]|nr:beta-ketoacyl-ACP synthase I [Gammaproteobacteria bacterium]